MIARRGAACRSPLAMLLRSDRSDSRFSSRHYPDAHGLLVELRPAGGALGAGVAFARSMALRCDLDFGEPGTGGEGGSGSDGGAGGSGNGGEGEGGGAGEPASGAGGTSSGGGTSGDTGGMDAGDQAGARDGGSGDRGQASVAAKRSSAGCSCRAGAGTGSGAGSLVLFGALLLAARRRR